MKWHSEPYLIRLWSVSWKQEVSLSSDIILWHIDIHEFSSAKWQPALPWVTECFRVYLFALQRDLLRWIASFHSNFYRWGNWGIETFNNLPQVTWGFPPRKSNSRAHPLNHCTAQPWAGHLTSLGCSFSLHRLVLRNECLSSFAI